MKKIILLTAGSLLCLASLYLTWAKILVRAQGGCCPDVPNMPSQVPRFPQGVTVNVHIVQSSGFTQEEVGNISAGLQDWNGQANNSGISYNVTTTPPPPPGTGNTIVVRYAGVENSQAIAETEVHSTTITGVLNVHMDMTFYQNIRNGNPPNLPQFLRGVARHEGGHGLNLDNADNCAPGTTIMNLNHTDANEDHITRCDNDGVNRDPNYPSPSPSPGCTDEQREMCWQLPGHDLDYKCDCLPMLFHPNDPILIDVQGNGFDLTNAANGVRFDVDANGSTELTAWTKGTSDDAFLVLDRNGNGAIDNGLEMFGDITAQTPSPQPNGFLALAEFDKSSNGGNDDGLINNSDSVFASLSLWQDSNHNGFSEPGELHSLTELGLKTLNLHHKESKKTDQYGNEFRYRAKVRDTHGAQLGRWAWDVFLLRAR